MNNINHILAYIPNKYKDEVAASVDDLQVEFQDSLIDFIESMTEGEYIAALFYSDNYQEISNTVSSAVTIDFPLIRIINYMNEEQIVDSIKLGFDNCVSLDNILRLHRVIKLNRQVSIKNKQKKV